MAIGKYGQVAIEAQRLAEESNNPKQAWEDVTSRVFGRGTHSQKKGCPREAFLGLCEEGKVKGVRKGQRYTSSSSNRRYAVTAVSVLNNEPGLKNNKAALWRKVLEKLGEDKGKHHNQQMDVVLALWLNHLLQ